MKKALILFLIFLAIILNGQSKLDFLKENRFDINNPYFEFPQDNFKVIGFGAIHGSSKTYDAELNLIKGILKKNTIDFYVSETNFSQAYYFQKYLETGDENLLRELVLEFQAIVSQEGSIETFNHWKNLKKLNDETTSNKIKVLGFDVVNEYKFPIKHIIYLTKNITDWTERDKLESYLKDDTTNFGLNNENLEKDLKLFIESFNKNQSKYESNIEDKFSFEFILYNISQNFVEERDREKIIYENYLKLNELLNLKEKKIFMKYGYFHIQKAREDNYPSFFTRLIENNIYTEKEIITIMGYLTKSEVLWDKIYDNTGNYKTFTTKKGYGIGDYWKEYFKGINKLKKIYVSDMTLFRLNKENSPYRFGTDLIKIKMFLKDYNRTKLKGKNTLDFIDYALLIRNSEAQRPIEELNEKVNH